MDGENKIQNRGTSTRESNEQQLKGGFVSLRKSRGSFGGVKKLPAMTLRGSEKIGSRVPFVARQVAAGGVKKVGKNILNQIERKVVTLNRGDGTTATIQLQGCIISSWRVRNIEQLFTPVTADYNKFLRFKGGITLSFPHDPPCEIKEIYELSRLYQWVVFTEPKTTSRGDITATLLMKDDLWTRSSWDHPFLLFYRITLRETKLICDLRAVNTHPSLPLQFKIHLQMNFQVKHLDDWRLSGLFGETYIDQLATNVPYFNVIKTDENDSLAYGKMMYRLYQPLYESNPLFFLQKRDECTVRRDGLDPFKVAVKISKKNFPDVTVRYPWHIPEKNTDGIKHKHLISDAKRDAVCVGTGYVTRPKKLMPGEVYRAVVKIAILPEENKFVNMAELTEPMLLQKQSGTSNSSPHPAFDMTEFCRERDSCKLVKRRRYNHVPTFGTVGFGWWSLTSE